MEVNEGQWRSIKLEFMTKMGQPDRWISDKTYLKILHLIELLNLLFYHKENVTELIEAIKIRSKVWRDLAFAAVRHWVSQ